jgi:hypothetical protein
VDIAEDGDRWVYFCEFFDGDDCGSEGGTGSSEVGVGFDAHKLISGRNEKNRVDKCKTITYTSFEKALDDAWIHGFVLIHLPNLGSDDVSRKAINWRMGKLRIGDMDEQSVTCFAEHLLFLCEGAQRCGPENLLASPC